METNNRDYSRDLMRERYASLDRDQFYSSDLRGSMYAAALIHFTRMVYDLTPEASDILDHAWHYVATQEPEADYRPFPTSMARV